jgi:ABC-type xylose transport system permease subunit
MTRHGRLVMRGWTAAAAWTGLTGPPDCSHLALSQKSIGATWPTSAATMMTAAVWATVALRERARRLQAGDHCERRQQEAQGREARERR